ncbi:MAG: hypothetical protein HW419_1299 [Deltaproteobacteria bacterium]|nr:hypothetical protein [Deltaproteobacteria bacterium]
MDKFGKAIDYSSHYVFEPALQWVINHPIISVVVVVVMIYFAVRNYRML